MMPTFFMSVTNIQSVGISLPNLVQLPVYMNRQKWTQPSVCVL